MRQRVFLKISQQINLEKAPEKRTGAYKGHWSSKCIEPLASLDLVRLQQTGLKTDKVRKGEWVECMKFSASQENTIVVRLARSKIRGKISIASMQLAEGKLVFIFLLTVCLTQKVWIFMFERLPSSYLLSVTYGFRNLYVSVVLAYKELNNSTKTTTETPQKNPWDSIQHQTSAGESTHMVHLWVLAPSLFPSFNT